MESDLREMINCPLCLENARDPRMLLQCQHTYCLSCLEHYITSRRPPHVYIPCPVCRTECAIPDGNVDKLPKNFFYKTLSDIIAKGGESGITDRAVYTPRKCTSPECPEWAEKYCQTGCGFLCQEHYTQHQNVSFLADHKAVDTQKHSSEVRSFPPCESHPEHALDLFCQTCDIPVCTACLSLQHELHDCCPLTDMVATYRVKLQDTVARVDNLIQFVKKAMKTSDKQGEKADRDINVIKREITATFHQVISKLKQERSKMLGQMEKAEQVTVKTREEVRDGQQTLLAKLESVSFYGRGLLGSGKDYDYVTNSKKLTSSLDLHSKSQLPDFTFTCQIAKMRPADLLMGCSKVELSHNNVVDPPCSDPPQSVPLTSSSQVAMTPVTLRTTLHPTRLPTHYQYTSVYGLTVHAHLLFLVHFDCDRLYVYSQQGLLATARVPGLKYPGGMAVLDCGGHTQLILSDDGILHWVTVRVQAGKCTMGIMRRQELRYKPWGIHVDDVTKTVIVTDPDDHRLHMYDANGRHVTTITMPSDITPHHVAVISGGGYIVCDNNNQLVWLTSEGAVTRRLRGGDPGCQFASPWHIVTDSQGRLLVADRDDHSVLLYGADGQYICHLLWHQQGFTYPTRLVLDEAAGQLWVSHVNVGSTELLCVDYNDAIATTSKSPVTPEQASASTSITSSRDFRRAVKNVNLKVYMPKA